MEADASGGVRDMVVRGRVLRRILVAIRSVSLGNDEVGELAGVVGFVRYLRDVLVVGRESGRFQKRSHRDASGATLRLGRISLGIV